MDMSQDTFTQEDIALIKQSVRFNHAFAEQAVIRIRELEAENMNLKIEKSQAQHEAKSFSKANYVLWFIVFLAFFLGYFVHAPLPITH
jgi:isoprenylcysteine carboxyl methyltransferase (ICMT) family protein YpbQ